MSMHIKYNRELHIAQVTVSGELTPFEFEEVIQTMVQSVEFLPSTPALWDMRAFDFASFKKERMLEFIEIRKRYPQRGMGRIAMVVYNALGFGKSRMFEILCATKELPDNVRVFRNLARARQWLLEPSSWSHSISPV